MSALFSLPTVSLDTGLLSVTDTNCGVGDRCRVLFIGAVVLPSTGNWTLGWEAGANGGVPTRAPIGRAVWRSLRGARRHRGTTCRTSFTERVAATPLRLPTGEPRLDLLEEPPVVVRMAERGPGGVGATLRAQACRPSLPKLRPSV